MGSKSWDVNVFVKKNGFKKVDYHFIILNKKFDDLLLDSYNVYYPALLKCGLKSSILLKSKNIYLGLTN